MLDRPLSREMLKGAGYKKMRAAFIQSEIFGPLTVAAAFSTAIQPAMETFPIKNLSINKNYETVFLGNFLLLLMHCWVVRAVLQFHSAFLISQFFLFSIILDPTAAVWLKMPFSDNNMLYYQKLQHQKRKSQMPAHSPNHVLIS